MTMFGDLLRQNRERVGLSIGQAAGRLGIPPAKYRGLEAGEGWSGWTTHDRIATAFGWRRSFN